MGFREIALKEIGEKTSFSRPTIYNYFQTKEEVFLALYELEHRRWNKDLERIVEDNDTLSKDDVAKMIASSLEEREQLLKLLSMNNFDMEANSREELLTEFKSSYGKSMDNVRAILSKFCPDIDQKERERLIYVFFPFMFGIYPYAKVSEKQRRAMEEAHVDFLPHSIYEITYSCLKRLLEL